MPLTQYDLWITSSHGWFGTWLVLGQHYGTCEEKVIKAIRLKKHYMEVDDNE